MLGGQPIALRDFRFARFAPMQRATLGEQVRTRSAVNRAIHTAAAEQRIVRCVHNRINRLLGDVAFDDRDSI
jgi:phosphatidate phosphatase APP1